MKREIKNRIGLLSILLVAGLLMASIGTALGAGNMFQGFGSGKDVALVMADGQMTIYEDGKAIENLTLNLQEGEAYTWDYENGKIKVGTISIEDIQIEENNGLQMNMGDLGARSGTELNEFIEIAEKDSKVQEIIEGNDYQVVANAVMTEGGSKILRLMFDVEGKLYEVKIDFDSKTVKSVDEYNLARME